MSDAHSPEKVWEAALGELQLQMTKATFETWIKRTQVLGCEDGTYTIGVQNGFARDWLEQRLRSMIEHTLASIVGQPVAVEFQVMAREVEPVERQTVTEVELQQEELELEGVRVRTYNEIVEPDKVFVGTQYFRRKWLPLLGRTAWLLILELRQRCYYRPKQPDKSRDTCKVTLAELGAAVGVSERTVYRELFPLPKDPEKWPKDKKKLAEAKAKAALVGEFILETTTVRRYSFRRGREVNETTLWKVRLDEPLTPEDRKKCNKFSTCQNDS
jgi:hypothetical protein